MIPHFQKMLDQLKGILEHPVSLGALLKNLGLIKFGFTDMSIVEAAKEQFAEKWVILTDERCLYTDFNNDLPVIYFSRILTNQNYFDTSRFIGE